MKHPVLPTEKRTVTGKQVKQLRNAGLLPINLYGKGVESIALQLPIKSFEQMYQQVGQTGLVDIQVDGQTRPALIKEVQLDPLSQQYIHADLFQVNLKEKIKAMVPIVTVGEPKAVTEKIGLLLQPLSEIEIEALPENLPEQFEIPVEHLAQVDDAVSVSDIKVPDGVEIITDKEQVVAKITELVSKEAEEQAAAEAAASEAAKAETSAEGTQATPAAEAEEKTESAPAAEETK